MTAPAQLAVVGEDAVAVRVVRRKKLKLIERAGLSRAIPYLIAGTIAIVAVVFAVLLEQVVLGQSAFKLAELRKQLLAAEAEHEELLLEVAKMESPDRIENYARANLGMTDPSSIEYIVADIGDGSKGRGSRSGRARLTVPGGLASGVAEEGGT